MKQEISKGRNYFCFKYDKTDNSYQLHRIYIQNIVREKLFSFYPENTYLFSVVLLSMDTTDDKSNTRDIFINVNI
jgi:hypothetical protein